MKTKTTRTLLSLTIGSILGLGASFVCAQDLVIVNGRILDGNGGVIQNGAVVIEDGKIVSVGPNPPQVRNGPQVIDAGGKTVMPGFVEGHRHVIASTPGMWLAGPAETWLAERAADEMQGFLDAGFTTVLSAIDAQPINEAKAAIASGAMQGPRLFTGTFIPVAGAAPPEPGAPPAAPGDPARTDPARIGGGSQPAPAIPNEAIIGMVQQAKANGYDYLKCVVNTTPGGPEIATLKLIVDEGKKIGMPTIVHAVSVKDAGAVIDAGPALLVHTPHIGRLDENMDVLRKIIDANIPMTSTLAVFVPHYDENGTALFRDALPFPFDTLSSAGQGPVNAKLLAEAGQLYGYGTDTQWPPRQSLHDELRALQLVFSPREIVQIMTKNAAAATMHGDEFGTLEAGKYGDVVIIDGDPMTDVMALERVVTTIKEGKVVYRR